MKVGPPTPTNVRRTKDQVEKLYGVTDAHIEDLRGWIATVGWPEAIVRTLLRCLDGDLLVEGWCSHCNGPAKVRYPDFKNYVAVVKFVTEYKLGKAIERREVDITHRLVQSRQELESMSNEQLAELASATDAEWKPKELTSG